MHKNEACLVGSFCLPSGAPDERHEPVGGDGVDPDPHGVGAEREGLVVAVVLDPGQVAGSGGVVGAQHLLVARQSHVEPYCDTCLFSLAAFMGIFLSFFRSFS